MSKAIISTDKAPAAIGPYSQAVCTNGIIAISGQIPVDPAVGKITAQDIQGQTEQCFNNLEAILTEADLTVDNIIMTTVYLTDMRNFAAMNEVYGKHIPSHHPARTTVQVAALPLEALVEIQALCARGEIPTVEFLDEQKSNGSIE